MTIKHFYNPHYEDEEKGEEAKVMEVCVPCQADTDKVGKSTEDSKSVN